MKRLLNTLYVTSQGSYLSREGETVLVQVEGQTKLQLPIHTLSGIVCFGRVVCSPPLMHLCATRNVTISFLSEQGRFWARVQGPVSGNVLLRREQYRRADDEKTTTEIARTVVLAKVANSRTVLLRAVRDHAGTTDTGSLEHAAGELARIAEDLVKPTEVDTVRGLEGEAARKYFEVFDHLIVAQKEDFFFRERSRRPPLDNMNALLSFLYTLLVHDVVSSLEGVGLDPAVGYLHRDRPGRPGLALDLMEEFRPVLADRLALSLVNRQQVKGKGFTTTETGAVMMDDETRKTVLVAYQKRKQEELRHPFLDEQIAVGLLPHAQAMLFARYLRGDIDGYPPFFWR
jgi:CRISPR-associated protein Cas1